MVGAVALQLATSAASSSGAASTLNDSSRTWDMSIVY
jgi:hypothetical protein